MKYNLPKKKPYYHLDRHLKPRKYCKSTTLQLKKKAHGPKEKEKWSFGFPCLSPSSQPQSVAPPSCQRQKLTCHLSFLSFPQHQHSISQQLLLGFSPKCNLNLPTSLISIATSLIWAIFNLPPEMSVSCLSALHPLIWSSCSGRNGLYEEVPLTP